MIQNTIPEIWINTVREKFSNGVPNGWLLNWDSERFSKELKELSNEFEFINSTSFDYAFCNSYNLFFPSQASENYEMATIEISFIVDAYQIFWTEYFDYGKRGKVIPATTSKKSKAVEIRIRSFLNEKGFTDCLLDWSEINIQNIQLELSEKATLGKCLFVDYED